MINSEHEGSSGEYLPPSVHFFFRPAAQCIQKSATAFRKSLYVRCFRIVSVTATASLNSSFVRSSLKARRRCSRTSRLRATTRVVSRSSKKKVMGTSRLNAILCNVSSGARTFPRSIFETLSAVLSIFSPSCSCVRLRLDRAAFTLTPTCCFKFVAIPPNDVSG